MENLSEAEKDLIDQYLALDSECLETLISSEVATENKIIESLVFPGHPRSFNLLDVKTSRRLLKASEEVDKPREIVICRNCEQNFSPEDFEMHLCEYDENHQLIASSSISEGDSELRKLQKSVLTLMKSNEDECKKLQNEVKNPEGYECLKCCRMFVHYNGMYRHWDSHVGELLPESELEDPAKLSTVTLCVFCGEVFGKFEGGFEHIQEHHIEVSKSWKLKNGGFPEKIQAKDDAHCLSRKSLTFNTPEKVENAKKPELDDQKYDVTTQPSWLTESTQAEQDVNFTVLKSVSSPSYSQIPISDHFWEMLDTLRVNIEPEATEMETEPAKMGSLDVSGIEPLETPKKDKPEVKKQNDDDSTAAGVNDPGPEIPKNAEQSNSCSPIAVEIPDSKDFLRNIRLSKLYQCEFCDSSFANPKAMLSHASTHAPSSAFHCFTCEISNISLKDLLLHRLNDCVIFRDEHSLMKDFPRVWICNVCADEFRGLEQLIVHRHASQHLFPRKEPENNNLEFMCEYCLMKFPIAPEFIEHVDEKHKKKVKEDDVAETSERIKKSPSKRRGGIHQTSTRPRQYLCEVCGKSYTQSSHLWQHLRFHQGVKPFVCDIEGCGRRFTIRPDLSDHVRKCHTGERPYLCTICDKRFLTGSVFYQHRLIHRNERRYGCEECGKRFYRADALRNHTRIHTGEKPYKCTECDKEFRQRGDRDKHMKARHPNAKIVESPKKPRVKSFGRGRVKNNTSLYQKMPKKAENES